MQNTDLSPSETFSSFREALGKAAGATWAPSRREVLTLEGSNHFDSGEATISPDSDAVFIELVVSRDTAVKIAELLAK